MKISKSSTKIALVVLALLFFSSSVLAADSTTFKTKKQGPKAYPGNIWKSDQTKPGANPPGKTIKKKPVVGQKAEDGDKPVRKGKKEEGAIIEPIVFR
jgi:hypothetical protein